MAKNQEKIPFVRENLAVFQKEKQSVLFLALQKGHQGAKRSFGEILERGHNGAFEISGRVLEMADEPFIGSSTFALKCQGGAEGSALSFQPVTRKAGFLEVNSSAVSN